MTKEIVSVSSLDFSEAFVEGDFFNLNFFWKAIGEPANQRPYDWERLPETQKLIAQICLELNTGKSRILKTKRGKGGGTTAHWKLALDYAGYLSVELKSLYYEWIRDRIQEDNNPELAVDRAQKQWKKKGKSDQWISERLNSIANRNHFTQTLQDHGCTEGWQYGACTNNIYKPILGGKASDIKQQRGLKPSQNLRDSLSRVELAASGLAEAIATEDIETSGAQGFKQCASISSKAGDRVSKALEGR